MSGEAQSAMATQPLARARALRAQVDGVLAACIDAGGDVGGVSLPYDGFLLTLRLPQSASGGRFVVGLGALQSRGRAACSA